MLGKRQFFRLKGSSHSVKWALEGGAITGEGKLSNISVDGMKMEIIKDKPIELPQGSILHIEPTEGPSLFLQSDKVKVIWTKDIIKDGVESLQCGLVFIKPE